VSGNNNIIGDGLNSPRYKEQEEIKNTKLYSHTHKSILGSTV
jgi:hypothetical protein